MKKNRILGKIGGTVILALSLTGCYNMRTNVHEPMEKCTLGESCEHYLLFAHDCRRTPKECDPICSWDLEKFEENKVFCEENWNRFKNFDPAKYQFRKTGIILLDDINPIIIKLAFQIKQEIIVPYIEMDKEGLISTYNMFIADVEVCQKAYNIEMQEACVRMFRFWQEKYGQETCQRLFAALPFIQSLSANKQLFNAISRNAADTERLLRRLKIAIPQLKKEAKDWRGIARITSAGLVSVSALNDLLQATAYLAIYQGDKAVLASHAEKYLKQFKSGDL